MITRMLLPVREVPVNNRRQTSLFKKTLLAGMIAYVPASAFALSFELGEEAKLDWDTTLRYSAAWRVEDQDKELLANANGDDGNRNFDKGLIQNRADLLTEADLNFGDVGAFVRARAYYDDVYANRNDHDAPATSNNRSVAFNEFTDDTQALMGGKAEFLDAFVYGNFSVGDRFLSLRAGDQVVNWGESLFLQGGISSAQSPLDATKANVPGVELKEIFLPVGQVFAQLDLTDTLNLSAYYQYEWDKTRLNAAGSYFSIQDFIDEGGETLILTPKLAATRAADKEASDSGQYGVALRYLAEALNSTEFGLYYINYHDKLPQVIGGDFISPAPGMMVPTTYHLEYVEDIQLYGASFSTVLGDTNVAGEASYRVDQPVAVGQLVAPALADTWQAQLSAIHVFGENPLMDNLIFTGEIGYNRVNDLEDDELVNDQSAWGYTLQLKPTYFSVLPGLDLDLPISFSQGVKGKSSIPGTFTEGVRKLGVTANFTYLSKYQASLGYTGFFGDAEDNKQTDRDFVSFSLKYTF